MTVLCRVMQVTRSAYYSYIKAKNQPKNESEIQETAKIKECFSFHRRRYGSRRIAAALKMARHRVRAVMKAENLQALGKRKFRPQTTDSKHGQPVSPNLLKDSLNKPTGQGEVFVGDITYLRLKNGVFCYLACLQDKFTRRIVGWKVAETMTAQLVIDVFLQARRPRRD